MSSKLTLIFTVFLFFGCGKDTFERSGGSEKNIVQVPETSLDVDSFDASTEGDGIVRTTMRFTGSNGVSEGFVAFEIKKGPTMGWATSELGDFGCGMIAQGNVITLFIAYRSDLEAVSGHFPAIIPVLRKIDFSYDDAIFRRLKIEFRVEGHTSCVAENVHHLDLNLKSKIP